MQVILVVVLCMTSVQGQRSLVEWMSMLKSHTLKTRVQSYFHEWLLFKKTHGKVYADIDTEQKGYETFKSNLRYIMEHNKLYVLGKKSFYLGINNFTDMTHEEFARAMHLDKMMQRIPDDSPVFVTPFFVHVPKQFDWRSKGYVTPVKNQGRCGSCWAFSTTGSMEGLHFKKTGKLVSLSEQQLLDCTGSYGERGCQGGLPTIAFKYIEKYGLQSEGSYKYKASQRACKYDREAVVAKCTGYNSVQHGSESSLQSAVATQGPVSVAIDANHRSFQHYEGGIYNEPQCSSTLLDHAVLAVGYGTDGTGSDYWIVKNSWGTGWGEKGYVRMSRNKNNQCGIASQANFPY